MTGVYEYRPFTLLRLHSMATFLLRRSVKIVSRQILASFPIRSRRPITRNPHLS